MSLLDDEDTTLPAPFPTHPTSAPKPSRRTPAGEKMKGWGLSGSFDGNLDDLKLSDEFRSKDDISQPKADDGTTKPRRRRFMMEDTQEHKSQVVDTGDKSAPSRVVNDTDDVMVVIPDLDDVVKDDFVMTMAAPPSIQVNRVKTIKELEEELDQSKSEVDSAISGIDLSLLSQTLYAPESLQEEDKPWDWEITFAQISSELRMDSDETATAMAMAGEVNMNTNLQKPGSAGRRDSRTEELRGLAGFVYRSQSFDLLKQTQSKLGNREKNITRDPVLV